MIASPVRFGNQVPQPAPAKPAVPPPTVTTAPVTPEKPAQEPAQKPLKARLGAAWDRVRDRLAVLSLASVFLASVGGLVGTIAGRAHNHHTTAGETRIRLEKEASQTTRFLHETQIEAVKAEKVNAFVGELFADLAQNSPERAESLLKLKAGMSTSQAKTTTAFFTQVLDKNQSVESLKTAFNQWFQAVPAQQGQNLDELKQAANQAFDKMAQNKSTDHLLLLGLTCAIIGSAFFAVPLGALGLYALIGPMVK